MELPVKKLSLFATLPTRGSALAAGLDLYSAQQVVVPPHGKALIKTDISIALPAGTYGRVAPRSGLAAKHHIDVGAGVIDGDYRGNVGVILFNHSNNEFLVNVGDRIAQLILEKYEVAEMIEVDSLQNTDRGTNGFGSTGVSSA